MKKAFKSLVFVVIMLSVAIGSFNIAHASSSKNSVYSYLTGELGFNKAAACGIMANMEKESNFDPTQVARDSNGLLSGGLCMWNGSRFTSLKKYCNSRGLNYLSVSGQLSYLNHELKQNYYKHIYDYLKKVPNTASGAYNAAYYWCYYFEIPANRARHAVTRGNLAQNTYWKQFSSSNAVSVSTKPVAVTIKKNSTANTLDVSKDLTLSWNSTGQNTKGYTVYLQKDGKVKKYNLASSKLSLVLDLNKLGQGDYKAYVVAHCKSKDVKSNVISFSVKCLNPVFKTENTVKATATKDGLRVYTCKNCGEKISQKITHKANSVKPEIKTYGAVKISKSAVTFKVTIPKGASGFEVYMFDGKDWKIKNRLPAGVTEFTVSGLSSGKVYSFKFRAFSDSEGKTTYSEFKKLNVPTACEKVALTSIGRPKKGTVSLGFKKEAGADGYEVFVATSLNGNYKRIKTLNGTKTSCTVSGLKSGTKYYFKVRAINKSDILTAYSSFSNVKFAVAK